MAATSAPAWRQRCEFITVYWLSGFVQEKFEIWKGRKDREQPADGSVSFTVFLLMPLVDSDESHLTIRENGDHLTLAIDWFPDEEFPLKVFASGTSGELLFMGEFLRETIFLHLT